MEFSSLFTGLNFILFVAIGVVCFTRNLKIPAVLFILYAFSNGIFGFGSSADIYSVVAGGISFLRILLLIGAFIYMLKEITLLQQNKKNLDSENKQKILIYSNTKLETAISLYRKFGFTEIPIINNHYERCDIMMEKYIVT